MTSRDKKLLPVAIGIIIFAIVVYFVISGGGGGGSGSGGTPTDAEAAPPADTQAPTPSAPVRNRVSPEDK
jgi:hypothetical protein